MLLVCRFYRILSKHIEHPIYYIVDDLNLTLNFRKDDRFYLHEGDGVSYKYSKRQMETILALASMANVEKYTDDHAALNLLKKKKNKT